MCIVPIKRRDYWDLGIENPATFQKLSFKAKDFLCSVEIPLFLRRKGSPGNYYR